MFSAVGKVLGYLWGDDKTPDSAGETGNNDSQSKSQNEAQQKFPKSRQFEGKISHVFSSHGLIDSEIYFSLDDVIGENKPSLGDAVSVVATQEYKGGGWLANQVTVTSDWGDNYNDNSMDNDGGDDDINLDVSCPAEVVGKVTHYRDSKGYINDNIFLDLDRCDHGDYLPAVGDWVKIVVSYRGVENTDIKAEKIAPLRVNETEGIITAFQGDHGYIDSEVFFTPEACRDHYVPRKWDPVSFKAVESAQGRCTWRAVSIQPSAKPDTTRLKLLQGPIQHSFMKDLLSNKEGIEVSTEVNFGSVKVGTKKTLTLWVRNVGRTPKTFARCHMTASSSQMKVEGVKLMAEYSGMKKTGNQLVDGKVTLYPTMALYVTVTLEARY